ncbi:MAG: flagellar basal body-associated FliL family protein [Bacteriovoracaceae bacterium]
MAEENVEGTEENPAPPPKKGSSNLLVTALVVVNTLLIGAIGYFQKTTMDKMDAQESIHDVVAAAMKEYEKKEDQQPEVGMATETEGKYLVLEGFTANLAQGDGPRRFIRLNLVLKFTPDSNEEEFKNRRHQIRDTIISLLNSKRPEDLLISEGKSFLKEEMRSSINTFLIDGKILDVFYTGFQIN